MSIEDPGLIAAVSPHLDDAVAGCGALLAVYPESLVITLFAGIPEATTPLTDWDRRCGFGDGQAAMTYRLSEDDKALHLLKAQTVRLPFLDDQYVRAMERPGPKMEKITLALASALNKAQAQTILFPIGLFHSDHILASDAALNLFPTMPDRRWVAYEDAFHRSKPGLLHSRLVQFYMRGVTLTPVAFSLPSNVHRKATAMSAYASQLTELGIKKGEAEAVTPERFWLLSESVKQSF